jgi:salicylate hydroxylase
MSAAAPVLIAGGGIGGLAAAIALAQHGIATRVLERRAEFSEAGAGIQLGPNGVRALRRLGVDRLLAPHVARPAEIVVHDGTAATVLARLPLGDWIEARHGAPYWVAHRRDMQATLLARAAELPLVAITTGFAATRVEERGTGIRVQSETGEVAEGAALIAADGQFSRLRQTHFKAPPLAFSGKTAARTVLDAAAMAGTLDIAATGVWLTSQAHVVHYPVRAGREVAIVAIVDEDWQEEDWGAPIDRDGLMSRLAGFSPHLLGALERAPDWHRWALFDAEALGSWTRGRAALLGDAAHPVLPFLAQGGAMALEDAVTLADCFAACADVEAALLAYERSRVHRTARVVSASRRNGRIYHLSGLAALARNAVLRAVPGARVMSGLDWLYGWRDQGAYLP